uniref:Transmembrane protein n=1 Tax=Plectus sambesii TaxID=2011161 RepID=A0A914W4J3_9BILA
MAAPNAYRIASSQQYTGAFPPPNFYRDTYGLDMLGDSITTEGSEDTVTTKSTVRTVNFRQPEMFESVTSHDASSQMAQSYQIEQVVTTEVFVNHPRSLLILALIQVATAIQLLVFGAICVFYDGCPYFGAVWSSMLFIANGTLLIVFLKWQPIRELLVACLVSAVFSFLLSVALFGWTAYLVDAEDKFVRRQGWDFANSHILEVNRIVTNTKIAMYSMHMILAPIYAICCGIVIVLLYRNLRDLGEGKTTRAYFFSRPPMGHQKVLVPIELKQVKSFNPKAQHASIAVQTSTIGTM